MEIKFEDLVGKTLSSIDVNDDKDQIFFTTECGKKYKMFHSQDCCDSVSIDDICGDLKDLVGSPVTQASEETSDKNPEGVPVPEYQESFTWTFYKLATIKGYVTIRWYGSSNGYYSEGVSFEEYP